MKERTSQSWQDETHSSSGPALPSAEVEAELQRILASPLFRRAPRHCRFLSFVVWKALAGEGDSVKEYLIGLEVFDRPADYDPGCDPVVRVEAGRLRSRLADYYKKTGWHDPIQIDLPKGTYVPVFCRNAGIVLPGDEVGHPKPKPRTWLWLAWGLFAVSLCGVVGYGVYTLRARRARALQSPSNILVLAEFTNTTGDAVFDGTLRQGLSSQLEQSPFLTLLSDQRIEQTLPLMSQLKDARLTRELAYEVCQRTGSSAAVEGSISSLGTQYVLGLTAVSCSDGKLLAEEQITADSKTQVLKALGLASTKLRKKLGESLASVQKYNVSPENVTTGSLDALQAYSLGCRAMVVKGDYAAAMPLFQRAINLDPNFAMAYARLATIYENLSQTARAEENTRKAYELRDRVSERERFYIDTHYYNLVTGNLEAARKTYELWAQTYPQDGTPVGNLGVIYADLGNYDKSLAAYQEDIKLNPGTGLAYGNLVYGYLSLNRLDEAKAIAQQAKDHGVESLLIPSYLYWVDFLQHNRPGMERDANAVMGKPGWEDSMLYFESDAAAYAGQFARARELMRRASESAQQADEKETAATYQAIASVHEALVGSVGPAKRQAAAALSVSHGRDVQALVALALALAGDSSQATQLAGNLAQRYPEDTAIQFDYLPVILAASALQSGKADKAIEALAPAAPYELGRAPLVWEYPVYLRGNAYLAGRQSTAATSEFQKILDHPGVVGIEPIGALAHLGLGRAYALSGDTAKAKTAYQDFLALWKDADADIPIYKQAKAEYAKLR